MKITIDGYEFTPAQAKRVYAELHGLFDTSQTHCAPEFDLCKIAQRAWYGEHVPSDFLSAKIEPQ